MKNYVFLFIALSDDYGRKFCSVGPNKVSFDVVESWRIELRSGSVLMK